MTGSLHSSQFGLAADFAAALARAQIGMLARSAALGKAPLAVLRDVSRLGAVRLGA